MLTRASGRCVVCRTRPVSTDEVWVWTDEVLRVWTHEVRVWTDEVRVWTNKVCVWTDEVPVPTQDGERHGAGILTFADGTVFDGAFEAGRPLPGAYCVRWRV